MKYVYLTLNWIFGVLFLLTGMLILSQSLYGGLCLIAMAVLLLPPIRTLVYSKTSKALPTKFRGVLLIVLFIAFGVFIGQSQEKEAKELAARQAQERAENAEQQRQEIIDYFNANREQIIASATDALNAQDYQSVISQTDKYLVANDSELEQLNSQTKAELEKIKLAERLAKEKAEKAAKTSEIVARLKTIPASQYEQNMNLYQQLVLYNPDDDKFRQKLDYYTQKLEEQLEKERIKREKLQKELESRIARFGEAPKQSQWDGSYIPVKRYLKRVANDPDSIEIDGCTKVYHTKNGWLVGCDYRGRNAFGGMIRQSNWFTIVHDTVIKMDDASAYRP